MRSSRRLLLLLIAALVPVALFAIILIYYLVGAHRDALRAQAVSDASERLAVVERELAAQGELIKLLARSPTLDPAKPDLKTFHEVASRFRSQLDLWHRVILSDLDGHQIVNTGFQYGRPLGRIVDEASHKRALQTNDLVVGDLTGPGPQSDGQPRISFKIPVIRDGKPAFVLAVTVSPDRLGSVLKATEHLPSGWRSYLVDSAGRFIVPPPLATVGDRIGPAGKSARAQSLQGVYEGLTSYGESSVVAYKISSKTGWSAHVSIPSTIYNAPIARMINWIAIAAAIAVALTILFILLMRQEVIEDRRQAAIRERSVRMESLGRMTGGVAHDFNNLLMIIQGNADILQRRHATADAKRYIDAIKTSAERATGLTRELLSFSRGEVTRRDVIELNGRLQSLHGMLRQSLPDGIALRIALSTETFLVEVDPIQLDVAILNITLNARDAIGDQGTIVIRTYASTFPDRTERAFVLSISDTGKGVAADALPHVFEPFFTTKGEGKGTGLGLSQVYGFAKGSGGAVDIESKLGAGTTIVIYFPEAKTSLTEKPSEVASALPILRSAARVLVVDDNEEVRSVVAALLTDMGLKVHQSKDAEAALKELAEVPFDLLVSDVVMPGKDGIALTDAARALQPELPVILMSGYNVSTEQAKARGLPIISKPFAAAEFEEATKKLQFSPKQTG